MRAPGGARGGEIWSKLRVPVYLYESAARRPDRVNLENIRRGQFEAVVREMGTVRSALPISATRSAIPPPAPRWWARANS
jgi:hypothetical protein